MGAEYDIHAFIEFLELAFGTEILRFYNTVRDGGNSDLVDDFNSDLIDDIFDFGSKYWLVIRAVLNHFAVVWSNCNQLIRGFDKLIIKLCISREIRSYDADFILEITNNLVPLVF